MCMCVFVWFSRERLRARGCARLAGLPIPQPAHLGRAHCCSHSSAPGWRTGVACHPHAPGQQGPTQRDARGGGAGREGGKGGRAGEREAGREGGPGPGHRSGGGLQGHNIGNGIQAGESGDSKPRVGVGGGMQVRSAGSGRRDWLAEDRMQPTSSSHEEQSVLHAVHPTCVHPASQHTAGMPDNTHTTVGTPHPRHHAPSPPSPIITPFSLLCRPPPARLAS